MKIFLYLLVFLISTSVYSDELKGLFGFKLMDKYPNIKLINFLDIQSASSVEELDEINRYAGGMIYYSADKGSGIIVEVTPIIKNDDFDKYFLRISPISGRIARIQAEGKNISETRCKELKYLYSEHFKDKYGKKYTVSYRKKNENMKADIIEISSNYISYDIWLQCKPKLMISIYSSETFKLISDETFNIMNDLIKRKSEIRKNEKLSNIEGDTSGL